MMMNNETQQRGLFHHHFRFPLRLEFGLSGILKSKFFSSNHISFSFIHLFLPEVFLNSYLVVLTQEKQLKFGITKTHFEDRFLTGKVILIQIVKFLLSSFSIFDKYNHALTFNYLYVFSTNCSKAKEVWH